MPTKKKRAPRAPRNTQQRAQTMTLSNADIVETLVTFRVLGGILHRNRIITDDIWGRVSKIGYQSTVDTGQTTQTQTAQTGSVIPAQERFANKKAG